MAEPLEVTTDGVVAWMSFTRPASANAIDLHFAGAFRDAVARLDADDSVSLLVLTGDPRFFSAGGDVLGMYDHADPAGYLSELVDTLHDGIARLADSRLVVISVVEGTAAGAGLALVLNSDVVISGPGARYLAAYESIGLTPDTGFTFLLPRVVGERRAAELTLLGRVLDAQTALSWGIVTEVVAAEELTHRVEEVVLKLSAAARPALTEAKRLLIAGRSASFTDQLRDERDTIVRMIRTPEASTRIREFAVRSGRSAPSR